MTQPDATPAKPKAAPKAAMNARRSFWLKQLHQWHWISAAVSLIGLFLFAVTGFGLTWLHARQRPSTWPLLGLGLLIPVVIALIFIH